MPRAHEQAIALLHHRQKLAASVPAQACAQASCWPRVNQHRMPPQAVGRCLMLILLVSIGVRTSAARLLPVDVGNSFQARIRSLLQHDSTSADQCKVNSKNITHTTTHIVSPCSDSSYPQAKCCTGKGSSSSDYCFDTSADANTCSKGDYSGCCLESK